MAKRSRVSKILLELYAPIKYLTKRRPKAAKKRRIMKKWLNRFWPDFDMSKYEMRDNPFLKMLDGDHGRYVGAIVPIPYTATTAGAKDE
jgi:hypothetical protein